MDINTLHVETWPIGRLVPYTRNPRKNDAQVDRMVEAIKEFGFRIPVVAKSDGSVVDGHLRLKAAQKLGLKEVPVALADELTDAQVKAFRVLANRSANWAEWDEQLLAAELNDLKDAGYDIANTGLTPVEIDDVFASMDMDFSAEKPAGIAEEGFGHNRVRVKVCLSPEVTQVLEKAISETGENNREAAVRKICEAYLEKR